MGFSLLLVVGAIVLGLLASDVMAKKAKMGDDEDEDAEVIDIEDFSWDIADLGEEVCLDYCKEKRKRPVLCQVIGQLAGMSADHTIGSINRFLSHRAKKILSKYKEPIFQMELRAKLRETTDEVLTSGTRNATEIREAFNKRFFQWFVMSSLSDKGAAGLTGSELSSLGGGGGLGGMGGMGGGAVPGSPEAEALAAFQKSQAAGGMPGGMPGGFDMSSFDKPKTPEEQAAIDAFHRQVAEGKIDLSAVAQPAEGEEHEEL